MPVSYPLTFTASASADNGDTSWKSSTEETSIDVTVPPAFGGSKASLSPEQLYATAILNCLIATYKTIAERKNLVFDHITGEVEATLDRAGDEGRPTITDARVDIDVIGIADTGAAENVAEATEKNCFIHRSVDTDIETVFSYR